MAYKRGANGDLKEFGCLRLINSSPAASQIP